MYALGQLNFLSDKAIQPHMTLTFALRSVLGSKARADRTC
jgi:hypothetical protein